ncbi:MAG: hypothetical protein ACXWTK_06290 [Methylobacter sp.]
MLILSIKRLACQAIALSVKRSLYPELYRGHTEWHREDRRPTDITLEPVNLILVKGRYSY